MGEDYFLEHVPRGCKGNRGEDYDSKGAWEDGWQGVRGSWQHRHRRGLLNHA